MSKLIALLAVVLAGALAVVLLFWRKNEESWSGIWSSAKDSSSSWSTTATHESGKVADSAAAAADHANAAGSELTGPLKGGASQAAHEADEVADAAARIDDATS